MTVNEVIAKVDALRPNAYTPEQKVEWLSDVDGKVSTEIQGAETPVTYTWPDDGDTVLLIGAPYTRVYELYILAMMDYYNSEYDAMNASSVLFRDAYGEYARNYLRTHDQALQEGFMVL
jgi:hypothetical protein